MLIDGRATTSNVQGLELFNQNSAAITKPRAHDLIASSTKCTPCRLHGPVCRHINQMDPDSEKRTVDLLVDQTFPLEMDRWLVTSAV